MAAAAAAGAGSNKNLTQSPTNLKEAIDWILRLTGKDGTGNQHCLCLLSEVIHDLVRDVEGYLDKDELEAVRGTLVDLQGVEGTRRISELVEGVAKGLQKFVGWKDGSVSVDDAIEKNKDKAGIANTSYYSAYDMYAGYDHDNRSWDEIYQKCIDRSGKPGTESAVSGTSGTLDTLARILLGAIPLVFSGLSYLYYTFGDPGLDSTGGKTNDSNTRVGQYMQRMGYQIQELVDLKLGKNSNGKTVGNVFSAVFKECGILEGANTNGSYAGMLEGLRTSAKSSGTTTGLTSDQLPLLKLNVLCSGYFRSLHSLDSIRNPRPRTPRTVREILYWLTSLPYCPIYRTLVPKVQEMFRVNGGSKGSVTFYGSNYQGESRELKVSDGNCASYLLGAALIAPLVLLTIQDTIESMVGNAKPSLGNKSYKLQGYTTRVAIHDLYANMQFYFSYPMSETQSYYLLQDCLVALYYQLYFLRLQCESGYTSGYGWGYCKYGDGVKCDGCASWICPVGDKSKHGKGQCGTSGKQSPLQAFLTDCLKGFTCKEVDTAKLKTLTSNNHKDYSKCYPEFLEHRGHTDVFGQECAVPMGFSGSFRSGDPASGSKDGMIGLGINAVLAYYATSNMSMSGLYQITRCICSLTRRVPRSTGTLYGFFYGLGLVYGSKTDTFKKVLLGELRSCPGWRNPECLMGALMGWTESDHIMNHTKQEYKDKPAKPTLGSLYMCNNNTSGLTCGKYLRPLTGALYRCFATEFCETYVSWIVHLSWRLHDGLRSLLDEFAKIDCSKSGCSKKPGSGHCCQGGKDHGKECQCANVVDCVGVHGLFYRFGFTYDGPGWLVYDGGSGKNYKRNCKQFYTQLKSVLEKDPFKNLQTQLRNFIYSTRALFGVYIGVYWLAVMGYLVYSMAVNLDILHIQSHWRSPGSYLVPLQRILADGSRKGFCTVGYLQEGTGDRLLSQGVSDVYL